MFIDLDRPRGTQIFGFSNSGPLLFGRLWIDQFHESAVVLPILEDARSNESAVAGSNAHLGVDGDFHGINSFHEQYRHDATATTLGSATVSFDQGAHVGITVFEAHLVEIGHHCDGCFFHGSLCVGDIKPRALFLDEALN